MNESSPRTSGVLFALAGVIAFSFRPLLIKLAYAVPGLGGHGVSAVTLLFLRMTLALPFFAGFAWWLQGRGAPLARRDWLAVCALGFVGYYMASFFDFLGLRYIGAGLGRLILFLYPTLVVLLSALFLDKRPTRREITALAISYAGIALVVTSRLEQSTHDSVILLGAALVFGSALCYAIYLVAGSALVQRIGSMRFTAYTMIVSTLPAVVQFFVLEPVRALELPSQVWIYAVLIATFCTVLPVFLVAEALKRIGANHFALIGAIGPVTTAVASAVGLEEPITGAQITGGALVIFGVLLVSLKKRS